LFTENGTSMAADARNALSIHKTTPGELAGIAHAW